VARRGASHAARPRRPSQVQPRRGPQPRTTRKDGSGSEPANRINVSEDKLDAKLARLELNLVDRITKALEAKADEVYVTQLHARIHTVEGTLQATALLIPSFKDTADDVEVRLRGLEKFRYAVPSASALALIVAVVTAVFTYLH
jgi:hypothetical protein